MKRRTLFACAGMTAAAVTLPAAFRPSGASAATPLGVGILPPSDIAGEPYYAQAQGFFRRAGLDVTIEPLANGPALVTAVLSQHLDIAYSNVMSLAVARERGLDLVILAPANLHTHTSPTAGILAVSKSSSIMTAKDLTGRTVAVEGVNSIVAISTRAWIDANGGDSKTIKFVEVPLSASVPAILSGRVDAAGLDAIHDTTEGKPDDPLRRLCASTFDAIAENFAPSVWFATPRWTAANPEAAAAFVRAMRQTATWANAHRPETAKILAPYANQTPASIQSVRRVTYGVVMTPALIQPPIDIAAKYGMIKASFPAIDMIANVR